MLVSFKSILQNARNGHYAVGAFNCLSLEHVVGAIQAAEELRSPIILQLAEVQFPCAPMELMAPVYLEAAKRATVPVAVHLDHGQSLETCVKAIKAGFNSVMFDGAELPFDENVINPPSNSLSKVGVNNRPFSELNLSSFELTAHGFT